MHVIRYAVKKVLSHKNQCHKQLARYTNYFHCYSPVNLLDLLSVLMSLELCESTVDDLMPLYHSGFAGTPWTR